MSNSFPVMEQVEARRLLSVEFPTVEWSLVITNTEDAKDGGTYISYLMLFTPSEDSVCFDRDPATCMQDYSWLGKGFEPTTYRGVPAVTYVGREPYVVDAAAKKKWTVKQFLAEYPKALDGLAKEVRQHVDVYRVDTDRATGLKTVILCDWTFQEGDYDRKLSRDFSASISLDGVPLEEAMAKQQKAEKARKAKHKKKAQRHHKKPVVKRAEPVSSDKGLAVKWGVMSSRATG